MKTQNVLIRLFMPTFLALLMSPILALSESNPIVLESGFVRVEIFAEGFQGPTGLAFDDQGNLYVTNELVTLTEAGTTVSKVTPDGVVTTFANEFIGPSGIAFNSFDGSLYVSDDTDRVFKVNPSGVVDVFAMTPGNPNAIAFDSAWNLYVPVCGVAPNYEGLIYKVTPEGVTNIFITGGFWCPEAAVFDDEGNLYVSDWSGKVFIITPEGNVTVYATFPGSTEGGLAFDEDGNLYVSCLYVPPDLDLAIYKITPEGVVTPFVTGFDPLIGTWNLPRGIIFDEEGSLYITEYAQEDTGIVWRVVSVQGAISDLIKRVKNLNLLLGLENSLVRKLEAAKRSLEKGNNNAAIGQLDAFIKEVQAQRGKKIDRNDADGLIGEADEIKAAI